MNRGRRDWERMQILGELPGEATVAKTMAVKELSQGGAQIETTFPLQINSLHEFRVALGSQTVVVKGRIVHCQIADVESESVIYRAGIEFVDLPPWVATALAEFLEAMKAGRQA
jgi:PilZ domain